MILQSYLIKFLRFQFLRDCRYISDYFLLKFFSTTDMLELSLVPRNIIILPFKELIKLLFLFVCLFVFVLLFFFLTSRPCVNKVLVSQGCKHPQISRNWHKVYKWPLATYSPARQATWKLMSPTLRSAPCSNLHPC